MMNAFSPRWLWLGLTLRAAAVAVVAEFTLAVPLDGGLDAAVVCLDSDIFALLIVVIIIVVLIVFFVFTPFFAVFAVFMFIVIAFAI